MRCHKCNGQEVEVDPSRGDSVCTQCGTVLEENAVVNEVSFADSGSGAARVVGQFVPSSGARGLVGAYGRVHDREAIIERGNRRVAHIASLLRLSTSHQEAAQRLFLLAVQRNFTKGRRTMHVAAAALYTVCRRERAPHMLIDFSDILQVPVKVLGQIYLKLVRMLNLEIPIIDPSLFMERFAAKLELGTQTHPVATAAVRLIQAMSRDWICTGRRPTGLCGAALLISSRYHGFCISADQVAAVVRISSPTLKKRLFEFRETPTAQLTREDFETTDLLQLPINTHPPSFSRNRRKEREKELMDEVEHQRRLAASPTVPPAAAGGAVDTPQEDRDRPACAASTYEGKEPNSPTGQLAPAPFPLPASSPSASPSDPLPDPEGSSEGRTVTGTSAAPAASLLQLLQGMKDHPAVLDVLPAGPPDDGPLDDGKPCADESGGEEDDLIESLSDVPDEDVDFMLLDDEEREAKANIWYDMTKDYLEEFQKKQRAKRNRNGTKDKNPKKQLKTSASQGGVRGSNSYPTAESAAHATQMALERTSKGFMTRLNVDALNNLFNTLE